MSEVIPLLTPPYVLVAQGWRHILVLIPNYLSWNPVLISVCLDFSVREVYYYIFVDCAPLQSSVLAPLLRRDILPPSSPVLYSWRSSLLLGNFTPTTRLHGVIKCNVIIISRFISLFAELHTCIATGFCIASGAI